MFCSSKKLPPQCFLGGKTQGTVDYFLLEEFILKCNRKLLRENGIYEYHKITAILNDVMNPFMQPTREKEQNLPSLCSSRKVGDILKLA